MRYGLALSVAVLSAVFGNSALAAVKIISEAVTADGKTSQRTIYLTSDWAKLDLDRVAIIIRIDTGKIVNMMKDKHEYMEIDPKELSSRMADAQAQMQQRLRSMPEAQRKQMETMLAQHGSMPGAQPGEQPVKISYEKTGETKTVGSWSCQVFHQKRNGNLTADLCIAPAAAVGLTRDDLASFHAFAETMRKFLPGGASQNAAMMDFDAQTQQIGFEGIPVETIIYLGGKARTATTIKAVEHVPVSPAIFEVPADYTKKEMPGFGRPGAAPSAK
jgi:hypothetical protein